MKIRVKNANKNIRHYIEKIENGAPFEESWEEEVIEPFWDSLCCYAPFDLSARKPEIIRNIEKLKEQCKLMDILNISSLENEFNRVAAALPNYDDDPIEVVIFPGDPDNTTVNEKQNGVVGTSLFGNMYIRANPLINGYEKWISYVFAHEYHHTVWGNYWYVINNGRLDNKFVNSLIIDGEADSFALERYPDLIPKWIFDITENEANILWAEKYKDIALSSDVDYEKYMFGDEKSGIPWCAGYAIGFRLVQNYLKRNKKTVTEILEIAPSEIIDEIQEENFS